MLTIHVKTIFPIFLIYSLQITKIKFSLNLRVLNIFLVNGLSGFEIG